MITQRLSCSLSSRPLRYRAMRRSDRDRSGRLGERRRAVVRVAFDARRADEAVAARLLRAIERGIRLLDPVLDVDHRDVRLGRAERAWAACSPVTAVRFVRCL